MTDTKHETKQNASHTPGPWQAITTPKGFELNGPDGFPVLRINGGMLPVEANARLIAAAPELLASLQEVVRICEAMRYTAGLGKNQLERIERAKALIAEAKGRKA